MAKKHLFFGLFPSFAPKWKPMGECLEARRSPRWLTCIKEEEIELTSVLNNDSRIWSLDCRFCLVGLFQNDKRQFLNVTRKKREKRSDLGYLDWFENLC